MPAGWIRARRIGCFRGIGVLRIASPDGACLASVRQLRSLLVLIVVLAGFVSAVVAQPVPLDSALRAFLSREFPFTPAELQDAEAGEGIVTILSSQSEKEMGVAGLIWVDGDVEQYLDEQRAMSEHRGTKSMPEAGLFRQPASVEDLRGLHLDAAEIEALGKCAQGSCSVKLVAEDLPTFAALPASGKGYQKTLALRYRQMLVRRISAYQTRGSAAMGDYVDSDRPVDAAGEFTRLLENSSYLRAAVPELERYLRDYAGRNSAHCEDYFSWSKVAFGLKPTVRLNHIAVYRNRQNPRIPWVVASKQVYAAHYLQAGLEIRFVLVPTGANPHRGYYLLSVNRSRNDGMEGFWRGILRSIVKSKTRDGMARYLAFARLRFSHLPRRHAQPTLEAQVQEFPSAVNALVGK